MSDENETPASTPGCPGWIPPARKSRKGMSKRLKRSLDAHAETESERRQARQKTGTPKRDDVGRAMLHAVLRALDKRPDFREAQALRRHAVRLLELALFSKDEAERVIADMIVRAEHDRREWIYGRKFRVWRDGRYQGPRPERKGDLKSKVRPMPRRPDGTMLWTNTVASPPGSKRQKSVTG